MNAIASHTNISSSVSLPALKDVRGGFNLQSSGDVDCTPFNAQHGSNSVIKGTYVCSKTTTPGNAGSTPSGTKKSSGSMTGIPAYLVGAAALVAGFMGTL
jgi:hypothetical protein